MDGVLFPHSIQKLFGLLKIAEIDEWNIDLTLIQFKRDMDFWKLEKNDGWDIDWIFIQFKSYLNFWIGYIVVVA